MPPCAVMRTAKRRRAGLAAARQQRFGVDGVQLLDKFVPLLLELLQDRPQQQALGGERMAAAIQAGLDPVFGDPQPALRQELPLHGGGMEIADFQHDLLLQPAAIVGKEVGKLGRVAVQARIHARGEDDRGGKLALGEAPQGGRGVAEPGRQLLAVAIDVAVALDHDVHVDAAGRRPAAQPVLPPRPLFASPAASISRYSLASGPSGSIS